MYVPADVTWLLDTWRNFTRRYRVFIVSLGHIRDIWNMHPCAGTHAAQGNREVLENAKLESLVPRPASFQYL